MDGWLTFIWSRNNNPIIKGKTMPIVLPIIIITNPQPYPKIMPANHIEGPDGIRNTGNRDKDAMSMRARTGLPKESASQCMIGIKICIHEVNISKQIWKHIFTPRLVKMCFTMQLA